MRWLVAFTFVLFVLLLRPTVSYAEPASPPTTKSYYGWQVLATDVAAQAVGFALAKDSAYAREVSPVFIIAGGPPMRAAFGALTDDGVEWASPSDSARLPRQSARSCSRARRSSPDL